MIYQIEKQVALKLKEFFNQFNFIDRVVIFGSRARHDCNPKSDIDICVYSVQMSEKEFNKLKYEIDQLPILFNIDIVHFEKVNDKLKDNILRDEKLFFVKKVKLKDSFEFLKKSKMKASLGLKNGKYRFFKSGNGKLKFSNSSIFEGKSLIIGDGGSANINYYNGKFSTSDHCYVIQNNQQYAMDIKYIYHYLSGNINILEEGFKGAGLKNISKKYIENIDIPLPSLKKQKQITTLLDKSQELIDLRKESIIKLDEFSKSIFIDMFGDPIVNPMEWNMLRIGTIGNWKGGGTPSRENDDFFKGNIPWITTVSLGSLYIDKTNTVDFITTEAILKSATKIIPRNSIVIGTRVGIGKVSINKNELCTNQDIVSLTEIEDNFNQIFIYYFIKFYSVVLNNFKRGATIQGITSQKLKDINIINPPAVLQNKFAKIIEKIEEQKELYIQELNKLQYNFDALLQKSFQG